MAEIVKKILVFKKKIVVPKNGIIKVFTDSYEYEKIKFKIVLISTAKEASMHSSKINENVAYVIEPKEKIDRKTCWEYGRLMYDAIMHESICLIREEIFENIGNLGYHEIDKLRSFADYK